MEQDGTPDTVGTRVARARKRRGLTQIGLAQRSTYSRSHIAQVEAGHKVATPAFVSAVAVALGMDPAALYGQPYQVQGQDDHVHTVIPELRRILAYVDVGPDLDGPPRSLDVLAAEVATARRLETQAQLGKLASRIPGVLEELTWWAYDSDSATAWRLLALAHRSAVGLTRRLGYSGDSLALLERAADAARRSGDPHLPHLMTLSRALLLMAMAQYAPAGTLLDRAAADVDGSRKDAHEVSGALALRSAIVASRAGDTERAWDRYGRATDQIRSGTGTPVYGLEFTPGNVSIHGAAVAAELGELDEAARRDHAITDRTLAALPPERRAHHEIDMSRVHLETGDYETALARLDSADRIAGQMVTFHPTARTTVAHLVDIRRTLPEPLRRLHSRMAV